MNKITSRVFYAMQTLDISELTTYPQKEIRPVLPSLVRMSLLSPLDNTNSSMESRKQILAILIGNEVVNNIVSYLQVNYHELEIDLKRQLQIKQKTVYFDALREFGLQNGTALCFERADVTRKVRVVLSEIFKMQWQLSEQKGVLQNEIFDNGIYFEEVLDILCIALAELPSLLNIIDLADLFLHINNGERIILSLIVNFPDLYNDLITHVIVNSDEESADSKLKFSLLSNLCEMNPSQTLITRSTCINLFKMPSFMLSLCYKYPQDLISFLTGMLLSNDQNVRSWFAVYIRASQKRKSDILNMIRIELLKQLQACVDLSITCVISDDFTIKGGILLRLYCALRGISGLKFNDEEIIMLSQLVTCRPQPTQSGLRFASLALCMTIACPSLVSTTMLENKSIEWLQWIIKKDSFFAKRASNTTSLGEMFLLLAIHFHSNQTSAISEVVCSTFALKIPIRPNSTNRIKQVFTQELFTEKVVASHAIRVPVTLNLNANIPSYVPAHCIHQLLKSRVFLKHKVPIKSWIYKQICNSVRPLHPVIPALIEVYVNSLINQNSYGKINSDQIHKPFTESEIMHIFNSSECVEQKRNIYHNLALIDVKESMEFKVQCVLTAQLLILYYLMLYEEIRLANLLSFPSNMANLKKYCNNLLSELPMKHLLHQAQKYQNDYSGLFQPLLRLTISNYPHLNMVEDWIDANYAPVKLSYNLMENRLIKRRIVVKAINRINVQPFWALKVFNSFLKMESEMLLYYAEIFLKNMLLVLHKDVPYLIQNMFKSLWLKLNFILPINFWRTTLNTLMPPDKLIGVLSYANESLLDPLQILRCSKQGFYSPHALLIILRILYGSLAASKVNIYSSPQILLQSEGDSEDLRTALIASQDSAAVQILLEVLDMKISGDNISNLELRETQGIVCSFIHQIFIANPSLAKLVHFQTYPKETIPLMVTGVPSLHICLDFLHEFLSVAEMDRQLFTIEVSSQLVLKYSIPKSLSLSKFCINSIHSSLSLLSIDAKRNYLINVIPSIIRFTEAFPVLMEDCINILTMTGKTLYSQNTLAHNSEQRHFTSKRKYFKNAEYYIKEVEETFETLVSKAINKIEFY